ncbi:hypothetical protein [Saccharothrix australiensis]|uniref:Uncharacterized protein n=1 Tax=Saccharothrix australiensis TaxID=2072 RepID=A0A495W1F2_9PSEU|nr:hypothetical protein [Saccharothrix australiensis]RKT54563.1 hypothetical protein C8E97_3207 [Saccharothrix australiensis]
MVFGNIFDFANKGAEIFSVTRDGARPRPGDGVDFEDADDDTYDDTHGSLFSNGIHGASARSKVVQEHSPEARAVLGFLGAFIQNARTTAGEQSRYAQDPASVSKAASAGMQESSSTVTEHSGLQKDEDLEDRPRKSDFAGAPEAPKAKTDTPPRASEPGK